ncbi:DoxX family protein [Nocardioides yefusunii]|uniref:DoxX family protein n=1 Tax=Nocardioides yefusunii TaxID=2500546 RepID=A0ABW1R0X5_9ACTN|nr:DoxX family protein [Nocardioides yefusunii]
MAITRRLARPLLASVFAVGGAQVLRDPATAAVRARNLTDRVVPALRSRGIPIPQDPLVIARATAGVQLVAAATLATGRLPRTSSIVLAATLVPSTVVSHPFWRATDPTQRRGDLHQTAKNASILGGLVLAAVDTEGKPGLAWRTRRATKDAKRQARHLARTASLEARLAATQVPGIG